MDKSSFLGSPSGTLVRTATGPWAFVPAPLPPDLNLPAIYKPLAEANLMLGELNGILRTLADPFLLIRPLQAREALTSSSMEGTFTTVDALLLAEAGHEARADGGDTREVLNYSVALQRAIASLDTVPLSLRTIRSAHRDLLGGLSSRRAAAQAGEFRQSQNWIGSADIASARFVPPPPREAVECLGLLERYLQRQDRDETPALVDAALMHYQFETIHPFADGNGRVGRILIPVMLFERHTLYRPALFMSPVLERRKAAYADAMLAVSQTGDWTGWINFFLSAVTETCRETIDTADRLFEMRTDFRNSLQKAGRSALLLATVDHLFVRPIFSIPQLAEHLGVTYPAAQKNVEILQRLGILSEIAETSYPKFFAARGVLDAIRDGSVPEPAPQ